MLYKDSGVDIDGVKKLIKIVGEDTDYPNFAFASPVPLFPEEYKEPYIVMSTDGVGTKIELAIQSGYIEGVVDDLIAMCVNDILVLGAKPVYFLDYIATSSVLIPELASFLVALVKRLNDLDIKLAGGETAQLPDMVQSGKFDVAGFVVGITEQKNIPRINNVQAGDMIIGFPSSGPHSNGFSLIRKILTENNVDLESPFQGEPLYKTLLAPTIIYTKDLLPIFDKFNVKGAAHITGGGIPGNLKRALNEKVDARVELKWRIPKIFDFIQRLGNIPDDEMFKVFNMGIGFALIVDPEDGRKIIRDKGGIEIGSILAGTGKVKISTGR